ncbi:MAG TPA: GNAT family N-acetyltransferase [Actinobacteria bacterium]|nr:acetyltransferase (GNAT) family protein [bacterium BMS3Bbin01]HDH25475.1 GNAT family N-acetyltransferase [Actinomycetota bacterium]
MQMPHSSVPECVRIDGSNLRQAVEATCGHCLYWEEPEFFATLEAKPFPPVWVDHKRAWFEKTWAEWGACGFLALSDGKPAGYVQYAPTQRFPGFYRYDYGMEKPPDAEVMVTCLHVPVPFRASGIGTRLLRAVVDDIRARSLGRLWAYVRLDSANNPAGPLDLYLAGGFVEVARSKEVAGASFALVKYDAG